MKKLNIAFIWHFHQPNYQADYDGDFLLPWARLHATKDYLDMLKWTDKFKNLKLNFDFSPVLLTALQKYSEGASDLHLKLFLKDTKELDENEKIFILNNYFDLNYKNMVLKRPYFTELYNKRANAENLNVEMFNSQEYSDIMANFTLLWIDESFRDEYKELDEIFDKQKGYTLSDRKKIYKIQLDIIKRILTEYREYQNKNRIEVSTSPYYHPVLPLLIDFKNKQIKNKENLPPNQSFLEDAKLQISLAIKKYEELFNKKPRGMWLSEQCICSKTAELLSEYGINWTISDEGILSKSLKKEFMRDFEGNPENPFYSTQVYKTKGKNSINILFGDSFLSNLINFGYGNYDYRIAANDLYEKIKIIQYKLQNSPKENHLITIAMDGENCWETYQNDGNDFLNALYTLISEDKTLKTVLVNDFIETSKQEPLENLQSGSWIKRNFDLWIGEATKNVAWLYLSSVEKDFEKYKQNALKKVKTKKEKTELEEKLFIAKREILISQSSDWYWWYGEPNESKSDGIFDFLFRSHLMNVYQVLDLEIPQYLTVPLANASTRPLRNPVTKINPTLRATSDDITEWENAGFIFVPDSPTSNISRLIKNIHFGYDDANLYFRFELNRNSVKMNWTNIENQIAIYFSHEKADKFSPIRFASKNENIYPILKNQFSNEVRFVFDNQKISRLYFNRAINWNLWNQLISKSSKVTYRDVIELKISLGDLNFTSGNFSFFIIDATNEFINEVYPQDVMINLKIN